MIHQRATAPILALAMLAAASSVAACDAQRVPPPASAPGSTAVSGSATVTGTAVAAPAATADRSVASTVTADGRLLQSLPQQSLAFATAGTLSDLTVELGQTLLPGDVVARVDASALELAVADARAAVAQSQSALAKLTEGAAMETARLQVEQAKNQLWGIQSSRDAICGAYERGQKEGGFAKVAAPTSAECNSAQANVQAAEQTVQIAEAQLRAAEATADEDLASAEAAAERARLALGEAQANVDDAVLTAPYTATVTAIHLLPGSQVGPGAPVVSVSPEGPVRFVTTNLSERNIGDVRVGAPALVTLAAYPDTALPGTVVRIEDQGIETPDGIVAFAVHIELAPTDVPLRAGMTGEVEVEIEVDGG